MGAPGASSPGAGAPRARRAWLGTAILALGLPLGAEAWLAARTRALAARLAARAAVPAAIGRVDASLTGTVRLEGVVLGSFARAGAVEASVGFRSLLAGTLGADEIRVEAPRLALHVDRHGGSELTDLARRLLPRRGAGEPGHASRRLRRVVVSEGALRAEVAGVGVVEADEVELAPTEGGLRLRTGAVRLAAGAGGVRADVALGRAAAELTLPELHVVRALAVGGQGQVALAGGRVARLAGLTLGRLAPGAGIEVRGTLDDDGAARAVEATVTLGARPSVVVRGTQLPLDLAAPLLPAGLATAGARATGQLVAAAAPGGWALALDAGVVDLAVEQRAVAPVPVVVDGHVSAALELGRDGVRLARASLQIGAIELRARGALRRRAGALVGELRVELPEAACADVLASVPAALRGPLDGMVLAGRIGGAATLAVDLGAPDGAGVALDVDLDPGRCAVEGEPPAADVRGLRGVTLHRFPDGSEAPVGPGLPTWTPLDHLDPYVSGAFVAAEDARFFEHHGFDVRQIARSLEIDLRDGRLVRGGSTISQQLVKNEYLTQRRSLDRKLQEAVLTWRLEAALPKAAILERYLNVIELGPRIFGLQAAARHWFGVSAAELGVRQSAFLAALTSEPTTMARRIAAAGGLDPQSLARVETVLRAMGRAGFIDGDQLARALAAPLAFTPGALAAGAPRGDVR